jgi:hypothetical protein
MKIIVNNPMNSPMLDAFMSNQKFTDKEASDIEMEKQKFQQDRMEEAYEQLGRSQNISDHIDIPGNIIQENIDQVTESHPKLRDYDHNLERVRTPEDMTIPEPEPEGLRLLPRGIPQVIPDDPDADGDDMPDFGIDWDSIGKELGL